jgi:hypothetical protein
MNQKLFFLLGFLMIGCKQESIVTYRVAKDVKPLLTNEPMAPMHENVGHKPIEWTLPAGWVEQTPSNMRIGSFLVKGENGQIADVSIVPLSGDAGGDLANINRWRGQINLGPIADNQLEQQSQIITPAMRRMRLVDFANGGKRVVAAIYTNEGKSWFFKMMGDDATAKAAKPAFLKFLSSIKIHEHE